MWGASPEPLSQRPLLCLSLQVKGFLAEGFRVVRREFQFRIQVHLGPRRAHSKTCSLRVRITLGKGGGLLVQLIVTHWFVLMAARIVEGEQPSRQ